MNSKITAGVCGFVNAYFSNLILGGGRMKAQKWDSEATRSSYFYGQVAGDMAATLTGVGEMILGGAINTGAVVLSPFGGISLGAIPVGTAIALHGGSTAVLGASHTGEDIAIIYNSFAKSTHSSGGGGQSGPGPDLRNGLKKVKSGEIPSHDTYRGREHPEWAGAKEYKVPGGGPQSGYRILELIKENGEIVYAWTKNHYKNITPF